MNKQEYQEYLMSPEWKDRRESILFDAGYQCSMCGDGGYGVRLDVHHLTYDRVGHERPDDLMVLCRSCHEQRHSKKWTDVEKEVDAVVREIKKEVAKESKL